MAGRHGRTSSMIIRSRFGLSTRAGQKKGKVSRPVNVQKAIKEEQKKQINGIAPKFIAEYDKRVANWKDAKPTFTKRIVLGAADKPLSMFIFPVGSEHAKKTFLLLDKTGRPGGITIVNKPGKLMRFRSNYFGKTAPGDVYGRNRRRTGSWNVRRSITQGPVEPRGFSDAIEEQLKPQFRNAASRGLRAGLNRIKKGA